jgi:outer membrane biosynthesis protein TonB
MMRRRSSAAFLIVAALMLLFADGDRTAGFRGRPAIPAGRATGSAPLFLLAENAAPGIQVASEESTPQQEIPAVDLNNGATPPQPEPQPADPPEQQGQPPAEHEQYPEPVPEPAPQPSQQ